MKIVSIEPTPSPHSMKINVTEELAPSETYNYAKKDGTEDAPAYVQKLFNIQGITNIYRVADFFTIARHPRTPWEEILKEVRDAIGVDDSFTEITSESSSYTEDHAFGEIQVFVQMFRGIPMQVKVEDGAEDEKRFGLPERFINANMEAAPASPNIIMERKWVEQDVRYGDLDTVGNEVVEELSAVYDDERLESLVKQAFSSEEPETPYETEDIPIEVLDDPDWRVRYAALDRLDPTFAHIELLDKALDDERSSIRRLAAMYLGYIEEPEVLPYIYKALRDPAANVRRTAGDCLSDLGYKEAIPEMIKSLKDDNRIVRWRAAMFLYELGDESAIPALEEAVNDPEFEVSMQVKMALKRIQEGQEAKGSIWQQMSEAFEQKDQ